MHRLRIPRLSAAVTLAAAAVVLSVSLLASVPLSTHALTVHLVCHTHDDVGWLKTVN